MPVLIVAKCIVNKNALFMIHNPWTVLIVAKCIVNFSNITEIFNALVVLIVAKCIVNNDIISFTNALTTY